MPGQRSTDAGPMNDTTGKDATSAPAGSALAVPNLVTVLAVCYVRSCPSSSGENINNLCGRIHADSVLTSARTDVSNMREMSIGAGMHLPGGHQRWS
jgi:hypothetical protein